MSRNPKTSAKRATLTLCLCLLGLLGSTSMSAPRTGTIVMPARKCSADCKFTSGDLKCGSGQTATCSCDSTGNFSGACYNAMAKSYGAPEIDLTVSPDQKENLNIYLKSLNSIGPNGVKIAERLRSVNKAAVAGDSTSYLSEQEKVHASLKQMDTKTLKAITAPIASIKTKKMLMTSQ
jgi:hypothetical protein